MIGGKYMIIEKYLKKLYEQETSDSFEISSSPIHGKGCFAKKEFRRGDFINHHFEPEDKITRFGAHLNHSDKPTAISKKGKDGYDSVYALKDILKGDEITLNYRKRLDLEQPLSNWD
jgi:hypothetical protein